MASFKQLEGIREDMSPNAGQLQLNVLTAIGRARPIDPNVIVSHSGEIAFLKKEIQAVSYTHLTLPTSDLV